MARIDPPLIFGCEVLPDVSSSLRAPLEDVQVAYCRRLLGLGSRSAIAPLFTETGLMPIFHRRTVLVLEYLAYISALPASHYAHIALADSANLAAHARSSWVGDLVKVLHSFSVPRSSPVPVPFERDDLWEANRIAQVIHNVRASSDAGLRHIIATSPKLSLLRMRLMASDSENTSEFRHYLHITTPAHRKAFTRLIVSNHGLAVVSSIYPSLQDTTGPSPMATMSVLHDRRGGRAARSSYMWRIRGPDSDPRSFSTGSKKH